MNLVMLTVWVKYGFQKEKSKLLLKKCGEC